MESYLDGKEPSEEDLIKCIRKGTLGFNFVPILTGSAFKNKGVQPLLDAVVDYLPSPEDIGYVEGVKEGSDEKIHIPKVTLPPVVEDGNQAPVIVEIDHPMDNDHYIKSVQILNFNDPVVIKGQCFFTPQSGQAFVSTQIRLAGGERRVWVVSECNQHGKWAISKDVKVAAGGC